MEHELTCNSRLPVERSSCTCGNVGKRIRWARYAPPIENEIKRQDARTRGMLWNVNGTHTNNAMS